MKNEIILRTIQLSAEYSLVEFKVAKIELLDVIQVLLRQLIVMGLNLYLLDRARLISSDAQQDFSDECSPLEDCWKVKVKICWTSLLCLYPILDEINGFFQRAEIVKGIDELRIWGPCITVVMLLLRLGQQLAPLDCQLLLLCVSH